MTINNARSPRPTPQGRITLPPAAIDLSLQRSMRTNVTPSPRVCQVAAMFGLGVDEQRQVPIVPPTDLTLRGGQVIFITGASGGGKTTLLRLIHDALNEHADAHVIDFDQMHTDMSGQKGDTPLVDLIGADIENATQCLAWAGLNDAFVMLRSPTQLSDGQRYRFRLAQAIDRATRPSDTPTRCADTGASPDAATPTGPPPLHVILADEFAATLDRLTAQIIARNVRKLTTRHGVCFIAATTHDDLLEAIEPNVLIVQHPGGGLEMFEPDRACDASHSVHPADNGGVT